MLGALVVSRGAQRLAVALVGATVLCGCLGGDLPAAPEEQSLEIVAGNPDPEWGPCLLNVDEVGAGSHEVVSMSMAGDATVRILDPSGAVLYEQVVTEQEQGEVLEGGPGLLRLEAGEHRVECTLSDGTHTADLLVVPARPGYEEDGTG